MASAMRKSGISPDSDRSSRNSDTWMDWNVSGQRDI